MRKYKVGELLKLLSDDGWELVRQRGSHRQLKHPTKKGTVTLAGKPSDTPNQAVINSIFKQAGWR